MGSSTRTSMGVIFRDLAPVEVAVLFRRTLWVRSLIYYYGANGLSFDLLHCFFMGEDLERMMRCVDAVFVGVGCCQVGVQMVSYAVCGAAWCLRSFVVR